MEENKLVYVGQEADAARQEADAARQEARATPLTEPAAPQ